MPVYKIIDLSSLIANRLQFFADLYQSVRDNFGVLSNPIFTDPQARKDFEDLSADIFSCLTKIFPPNPSKTAKTKLESIIDTNNHDLLTLSLFKALVEYLGRAHKQESRFGFLTANNITITPRPPNPIYEKLPNPVRKENAGITINEITDMFRSISFLEEGSPRVKLLNKDKKTAKKLKQTNTYLEKAVENLRIAVTHLSKNMVFDTGSLLATWPKKEKTPYWFKKIKNREEIETQLDDILKTCRKKGVHLLVLPELTIDKSLQSYLSHWLETNNRERVEKGENGLILVVAGSFHVGEKEDQLCNISTIFDHQGSILWEQKKLQRYSFDRGDIKNHPALQEILKTSDEGGHERTHVSDALYCLDTPIGRIAVCICIDFFHEDHREALRLSGINLFLVPAMTPGNTRFQDTAKFLGTSNHAAAFIANSGWAAEKSKGNPIHKDSASFYYLPSRVKSYTFATGENKDILMFDINDLPGVS